LGGSFIYSPGPVVTPTVTAHPSSQTRCAGTNATFISAATGEPVPAVHWQVSTNGTTWTDISGATNATLTFVTTIADANKRYRAVWTNDGGSVTSTAAILTINAIPATPGITLTNNCESSVLTATGTTVLLLWSTGAITPSITVFDGRNLYGKANRERMCKCDSERRRRSQ
jgi:hypothetical protein